MKDKIREGDIVSVSFHGSQFTLIRSGKVLYIPCATGDSWHIRDNDTKDVYYISEGCTIKRLVEKLGG